MLSRAKMEKFGKILEMAISIEVFAPGFVGMPFSFRL